MIHTTQPVQQRLGGLSKLLRLRNNGVYYLLLPLAQFASQRVSSPATQKQHCEHELTLTGQRPSQEVHENFNLAAAIQAACRGAIAGWFWV